MPAPFIIAQEKGYFTREGLNVELLYPDQPAMIAQGTIGGELDFGIAAPTAAFYNLARQGTLRIIAANSDEAPGFKGQVLIVSNAAYAGGLQSPGKLAGHSSAITIAGSPQQYVLGVLAQKYRFD